MGKVFSAAFAMPLMDCLFDADQSATHCMYQVDPRDYGNIDNVYVVCIADNSAVTQIRAGLVMKSDLAHTDAIFPYAVTAAISASPILAGKIEPQRCTFFPARIKVDGPPLTEPEMLQLLAKHYSQFSFRRAC
ncbi:hypothetical protein [Herbaspirillum sp. SJZ099]|uniref:hypothetical protein n=1 Tax=Herbaspirillum sp. SJZ099 TaxID=2572916 RepID=UPI0011AADCC8|nr:hypothetical protein [Herbaspirillum sp. SJZ099]TWC67287.1 hypothetical protein FB597_10497 [Herbaspirillum sp. SJZ099]